MYDFGVVPEPPQWALDAGLPEPFEGEGFSEYVNRIGLDPAPLLVDLHRQTACCANGRLAHTLKENMRYYFDRHVESLVREHMTPERHEEIAHIAKWLWPTRYRKPSAA